MQGSRLLIQLGNEKISFSAFVIDFNEIKPEDALQIFLRLLQNGAEGGGGEGKREREEIGYKRVAARTWSGGDVPFLSRQKPYLGENESVLTSALNLESF